MRSVCLFALIFLLLMAGCKPARKVSTSFYYWKTVYRQNPTESKYLKNLNAQKLFVRIMDIDLSETSAEAVPVSPIEFKDKLPDSLELVPVVYIVNNVLRDMNKADIAAMAPKIIRFVNAKVKQAGKSNYQELQIDCDWTAQTRDKYFYLLQQLRTLLLRKTLCVTLRLHQLKNLQSSGIPPANKVLLMCYNMGNLRKYGNQNSIINLKELKKFAGENIATYPLPVDVALPLFSWAVAFRNKQYLGIARQIKFGNLNDRKSFLVDGNNLYQAQTNLPAYGLLRGDEVRWETTNYYELEETSGYIARFLNNPNPNIIFFHLDETVIKNYSTQQIQALSDIFN